ncbi:MAG: hypothetical protein AB8A45_08765, partial [Prochlorococcus sp.]
MGISWSLVAKQASITALGAFVQDSALQFLDVLAPTQLGRSSTYPEPSRALPLMSRRTTANGHSW